MTIQTDSTLGLNYVEIQPFKVTFNDASSVTRLYVISVSDNLINNVIFQYQLTDDNNVVFYTQCVSMSGEDYMNWAGDNITPFTYVSNLLNFITI